MTFQPAKWPPPWPEIESALQQSFAKADWGQYDSAAHEQLTKLINQMFGVSCVRLCCSGTAAVELALRSVGIDPGDEVLVCGFDYPGNVRCIHALGAVPVLVDVARGRTSFTAQQATEAAGLSVRAMIVSHLYGQVADVLALRKLADERGWYVIEDACGAPGTIINTGTSVHLAGSIGHVGTLSFGGSKPLTAGNGGAILTNDARIASRLSGMIDRPSDTFPLSALQAAVIPIQLARLSELNAQRSATAHWLFQTLRDLAPSWQLLQEHAGAGTGCYYKFPFLAQSPVHRDAIIRHARDWHLPIGEGFRSLERLSEKRCRKPMPLEGCRTLGARLCVLSHQALMINREQYPQLADALRGLHQATMAN